MSESKNSTPEVLDMRRLLAEVRRTARGVKESARNLRSPKSDRLSAATDTAMRKYDSQNPEPLRDDTTRRS